jgi:hypothetical protein
MLHDQEISCPEIVRPIFAPYIFKTTIQIHLLNKFNFHVFHKEGGLVFLNHRLKPLTIYKTIIN